MANTHAHTKQYFKQLCESLAWDKAVFCKNLAMFQNVWKSTNNSPPGQESNLSLQHGSSNWAIVPLARGQQVYHHLKPISMGIQVVGQFQLPQAGIEPPTSTPQSNTVSNRVCFTVGFRTSKLPLNNTHLKNFLEKFCCLEQEIKAEPLTWQSGCRLDCRSFQS